MTTKIRFTASDTEEDRKQRGLDKCTIGIGLLNDYAKTGKKSLLYRAHEELDESVKLLQGRQSGIQAGRDPKLDVDAAISYGLLGYVFFLEGDTITAKVWMTHADEVLRNSDNRAQELANLLRLIPVADRRDRRELKRREKRL